MDKNELSDPPVAKQLQALNTDLPNHTQKTLRYCYYYHFRGQ